MVKATPPREDALQDWLLGRRAKSCRTQIRPGCCFREIGHRLSVAVTPSIYKLFPWIDGEWGESQSSFTAQKRNEELSPSFETLGSLALHSHPLFKPSSRQDVQPGRREARGLSPAEKSDREGPGRFWEEGSDTATKRVISPARRRMVVLDCIPLHLLSGQQQQQHRSKAPE